MTKRKKKQSARHAALVATCFGLGLVLVMLLAGTVYAEYLLGSMKYVDKDSTSPSLSLEEAWAMLETEEYDPNYTGSTMNEEDVDLGNGADVTIGGNGIVNILLIGADYQSVDHARSDSMILCTFNTSKNTITMTSFMRDTYVAIPGYGKNKLNASYAWGGMSLLKETLEHNFGVQVDGIVEVDFSGFEDLIDLLGGVTIDLNYQEASFINLKSGSKLSHGVNVLTGTQALWYARNRGDAAGDFNRTNRQRVLLNTIIEEYKNSDLTTMMMLLTKALPLITTDLTKAEIASYVKDYFPMLADCEIVMQRIPIDDGYYQTKINGQSVLVPDLDKNVQALLDSLT